VPTSSIFKDQKLRRWADCIEGRNKGLLPDSSDFFFSTVPDPFLVVVNLEKEDVIHTILDTQGEHILSVTGNKIIDERKDK